MMPTDWPTIRSTNCCWGAIRSTAAAWRRSRRSRASSTPRPRGCCSPWATRSPTRVIARHRRRRRRVRLITIDLDVTEDQTHGAQQLTFFNGLYDHWCYLPLVGTLTFDDEARQYLVAAILRPGNAAGHGRRDRACCDGCCRNSGAPFPAPGSASASMPALPRPEIFAHPGGRPGVEYVVAMGTNAVLDAARRARTSRRSAPSSRRPTTPRPRYGEAAYQTRTWPAAAAHDHQSRSRVAPRAANRATTRALSSPICGRRPSGSTPTSIAPAATARIASRNSNSRLAFGRTSCTRFWANQLRITLTAAAFVLLSRAATARRPDRAARGASPAAAAGPDHDRRAGRALRPPDRPAFPPIPSRRRHVGASRPRARRRARVTAPHHHVSSRRRCRRRRTCRVPSTGARPPIRRSDRCRAHDAT